MSRIVAFLRSNALLGVACVIVLWPFAFIAFGLVSFDLQREHYLAVSLAAVGGLVAVSAFMLCMILAIQSLWQQRRWVLAAILASPLIASSAIFYGWFAEITLEEWRLQALHDRIAKYGQVSLYDVATGWDTVCACRVVASEDGGCYVGHGAHRYSWQLRFYRHSNGEPWPQVSFLELPMPGLASFAPPRANCFTLDQAPMISRDPLYDDLLALMARPSRTAPEK